MTEQRYSKNSPDTLIRRRRTPVNFTGPAFACYMWLIHTTLMSECSRNPALRARYRVHKDRAAVWERRWQTYQDLAQYAITI